MVRILLTLAAVGLAGQGQTAIPWWSGTWEAAFDEARRRNVPVLVAFLQDHEEANDRIIAGLYAEKTFIKACERAVALLANRDEHGSKAQDVDGDRRSVCARFGWTTCRQHGEIALRGLKDLWKGGAATTPSHFVLLPDGTEVGRVIDVAAADSYEGLLREARKKLGHGLTAAELKEVEAATKAARQSLEKDEVAAAMKAVETLEQLVRETHLEKEAAALRAALTAKGKAMVARATQLSEAKDAAGALRVIAVGKALFKGTAVAKELDALERRLDRTPEGREAQSMLRREEQARPEMEKAAEAAGRQEWVRAYASYVKAAERAGIESPLGKEALERTLALARDPDIGPLVAPLRDGEAAKDLQAAERLLASGSRERAEAQLRLIVALFEGSPSAGRAAQLLEKRE